MLPVLIALGVLAAISIVLVVVVMLRPSEFRVSRTAYIAAPVDQLFAEVNDFRRWIAWSPYDKRDPLMKRAYDGPPTGVGARYSWNGNGEVGEGNSTIIDSREGELIRIRLEFIRPFCGISTAEFAFLPAGDQTAVTWSLHSQHSFMAKAMSLVINMDKMIGGDFEAGLENLGRLAESRGRQPVAVS